MDRKSADEAINHIKSIYCKDCDNYGGVRCRACDFDCAMSDIDDLADPNQRVITWHEYPQEKPTKVDWYMITTIDGFVVHAEWNGICFSVCDDDPIAWAELPKPYKKEANNDH